VNWYLKSFSWCGSLKKVDQIPSLGTAHGFRISKIRSNRWKHEEIHHPFNDAVGGATHWRDFALLWTQVCGGLWCAALHQCRQESSHHANVLPTACGPVCQLVFANLANVEVSGLGVGQMEAAHAGGGGHDQAFRQGQANVSPVKAVRSRSKHKAHMRF
jgi:hypothetical protein